MDKKQPLEEQGCVFYADNTQNLVPLFVVNECILMQIKNVNTFLRTGVILKNVALIFGFY